MNPKIVLYELAKRMGSADDIVSISSLQFAEALGVSQQSASRYLKNLEHENLIKRKVGAKKQEIKLTSKGAMVLNEIYFNLKDFFENKKEIIIEGEVVKGIGEGAYYMKEYYDKINEKLNFAPYGGTLNIKLNENFVNFNFGRYVSVVISVFKKSGRTFGKVKCIPVKLFKDKTEDNNEDCFIILPERTHHKNIIEIISEFNLREKLNLKEGDGVKIVLSQPRLSQR